MQVTVDSHEIASLERLNDELRLRLSLVREALEGYNSGHDERIFCLAVDRALNGPLPTMPWPETAPTATEDGFDRDFNA